MSLFEKKKPEDSGDTWGQVFADIKKAFSERPEAKAEPDAIEAPVPKSEAAEPVPSAEPIHAEEKSREEVLMEPSPEPPPETAEIPASARTSLWKRLRSLSWKKKALVAGCVGALIAVFLFRQDVFAPWPPAPNVVATFIRGQITLEDVEKHLASLVDDKETQSFLKTAGGYALLVEEMITDELVRRWSENRKPESDKDFSHVMKHITEEVNLDELHVQMHKGQLGVSESDIQAYYDANAKKFSGKTLTDVRDEIKATLQSGKEDQFVQNYIAGLKNKASITRDLSVLNVPEPSERELQEYYAANAKQFMRAAEARVQVIRIPKSDPKANEKADQALVSIRSGASFAAAAQKTGMSVREESVMKDSANGAYERAVFALDTGAVSEVVPTADSYVIAKLVSKAPEREQRLDEVRAKIFPVVRVEKEKKYFADNADRTLFTVNGTRYTLGEFGTDYGELPASFLEQYPGTKGKQALVEKIIERALLYEDSLSQVSQTDTKEKKDEMRLKVLAQMMEQEEVDEKIVVEDADVQKFYDENIDKFKKPARSKIRHIAISMGKTDEEYKQAVARAEEAYKKLVPGFLKKGANFADIAREYSDDEATKNSGGEMADWISEDESEMAGMHGMGEHDMGGNMAMHEMSDHGFYEQILAIEKGEIGQPFAAEGFIHIVEVVDREDAGTIPLEDVKGTIQEVLKRQKHDELAAQLSKKLLKDADVVIYSRTLRKLPETSTE